MKYISYKILAALGVLLTGLFFGTPFVFASTILQQPYGIVQNTYPLAPAPSAAGWEFSLGNYSLSGSTSPQLVSVWTNNSGGSASFHTLWTLSITGYSDAGYSSQISYCQIRRNTTSTTETGFQVGTEVSSETGLGCNFNSLYYYKITFTGLTLNNGYSQTFSGVNSSVAPLTFVSTNTDLAVPAFIIGGVFQSLDPNLINGGNPSGVSTSTIQQFCNSTYATSTGWFSDISNGVTYGLCTAFAFLFVPDQSILQRFSDLSSTTKSKIPFSYFYGINALYSSLTASSTANLPSYGYDLPVFGTTTAIGNVLPTHLDILSTTTISKYYPDSIRNTFLLLGSFAIWGSLILILYKRVVPDKVL